VPEGDTIFKTAAALRPLLLGKPVLAAQARQPGPQIQRVVGAQVTAVEPIGKHMVIRFSNGLALHTHLRMNGTWHRYAPGERWRKPAWQARVVLHVPEHVVVCFNAPVAELMRDTAIPFHPGLKALGPDLLSVSVSVLENFDHQAAFERLRARPTAEIAEALLDQRALAGIGNVFKSEILFLEGVNPWAPVAAVPDTKLHGILETAERLLKQNVRPGSPARITTRQYGSRLWVYSRSGRPCLRCRTPIQSRRQGQLNRWTYWCPVCQRLAISD
jgi:endonuclease-8